MRNDNKSRVIYFCIIETINFYVYLFNFFGRKVECVFDYYSTPLFGFHIFSFKYFIHNKGAHYEFYRNASRARQ